MKRFITIGLVLIAVLVAALVAVPFLVPVDSLKTEVLAKVEAATGRKVSMGTISLSLFPTLALSAADVKVSNPQWAGGGDMADIKSLRLGVELLPLLHKDLRLTDLTLDTPVITLIKNGPQANWELANAAASTAPATRTPANATKDQSLGAISLGSVTLKNGTVTYKDLAARSTQTVSDIDMTLNAPNPLEKAKLALSFMLDHKKADIKLDITKPMSLASHSPSDVDLDLRYGPLAFTWKGTIAMADKVPTLGGVITIPKLDTADFSSGSKEASAGNLTPAAAAGGGGRWSEAPIDLSGLKGANADVKVAIGTLVLPKATLSNIELAIHLQNGALSLSSNQIAAYDGTVKFAASANSNNAVALSVDAQNVKAEPLLHDFAGYDRLSGALATKLNVTTSGASERAMIHALAGSGDFRFTNGSLRGVDIAGLVRSVGGLVPSSNQSTDFSELSGSYVMKNGIANNNDLVIASPLLRVTGKGEANLPEWTVNYLLEPKLEASLSGGKSGIGVTVPIRVSGALDNPSYRPDVEAALKDNLVNPTQLKQDLNALAGQKLNSDTLKGLLR